MKQNFKIYLILLLVIAVWGILFYRIFSSKGSSNNYSIHTRALDKQNIKVEKISYTLTGNYRDPFLGSVAGTIVNSTHVVSKVKDAPKTEVNKPVVSSWPKVEFLGLFRNQKAGKELILLSINGQSHTIRQGDVVEGITINKLYKDSILVSFNKEKKIIRK